MIQQITAHLLKGTDTFSRETTLTKSVWLPCQLEYSLKGQKLFMKSHSRPPFSKGLRVLGGKHINSKSSPFVKMAAYQSPSEIFSDPEALADYFTQSETSQPGRKANWSIQSKPLHQHQAESLPLLDLELQLNISVYTNQPISHLINATK